ncbi:2-dehydropantoate 2-reductase [Azoarcus sp. L1K30]|uniref:2-dehydropantoate 2-reductase n=1 Tax=Azoarcus sp. L1K30 TaxID=2820277 RepID=UPI001B8322C1|nr:2-dehydropantoate 2-reductase [Azoarcus sp. L1K30]MBR0567081.1 2-dehydropantoate 2-reductase [Azoarcus sp. L1K30]
MKICLYGAGAVGGLIGARIAATGQPLSVVARGSTLAALQHDGLGLQQVDGRRHFAVTAVADPGELGPQDLVIVAVKEPAMAAVAEAIGPLIGPDTKVMTAMNGVPWWFFDGLPGPLAGATLTSVDPTGELRSRIPSAQVIGCVVHIACATLSPGVSLHKMGNGLVIGDATGPVTVATRAVAGLLTAAGFDLTVSDRIQRDIWFKLWGNMTMNPVSAITGATSDRILDDELVESFCVRVMEEAAAVGERIGCPVAQSPAERNAVTRKLGAMKTSMLQDVEAGRALEIDALLGVVHEIAGKAGVEVPNIAALLGLVRLFARTRGLY